MNAIKRTYVLPSDTMAQFEREVPSGERSSVIAKLIEEWVEDRRRAELTKAVIECCREMAEEYLAIEKEFHPLEEEVERARGW